MSFVDKVEVQLKAGKGGDGRLSFRQEKFVDRGGPDGGDGGNGGDIIAVASRNQNTLANFRYQKELRAAAGEPGSKQRKHGKSAPHLLVPLPVGTLITTPDGTVLADLVEDGQQAVIAKGGKGGFGNAHFISSTRQAPRIVEKGEAGEELAVTFELKMIADVGLVGLPNAGKSTLLSVISNARPEIANYPFTTLTPHLGVVDVGEHTTLLVADIPGLIAGAAEGKGLGDEFLRHVERTGVLLHLIDVYEADVVNAYTTIQAELAAYVVDLSSRPQIVVLTKTEGLDKELVADVVKRLRKVVPKSTQIMAISAQAGSGVRPLLRAAAQLVTAQREALAANEEADEGLPVISLPETTEGWQVTKAESGYLVTGAKIERFAARTDFSSEAGVQRLRDIMKRMGVLHELSRQGAVTGSRVAVGRHGSFSL